MQTFRWALVPLRFRSVFAFLLLLWSGQAFAKVKIHTVALGASRHVRYTPPDAGADAKSGGAITLRVRPLYVDGAQREWTVGELHDVTDRSFTIRRVLRINDALPGEAPRWSWQPGPWLMVDRVSGRISALHLPAFDPQVSEVVWFRDYSAYCGITTTMKGGLVAVVSELGHTKPVAEQVISTWPRAVTPHPACGVAKWQRAPIRATIAPSGGDPITFDVVGIVSLVEEGESGDEK